MSHHYITFFFLFVWMIAPLICFWRAPHKNRDPYVWIFLATLLGPLVALVFLSLPAKRTA